MVPNWIRRLPRRSALVLAAALGCGTATAEDVPRAVAGLLHDNAAAAQKQLRDRGYALTASDAWRGKTWQYWWHRRDDVCLLVALDGGRVERLESTSETNCAPNGSDPARLSAKGRVAAGAARALGGASLQHRSHERDERRYGDTKSVAEFERGYRDALKGAAAGDRRGGDAYADGYSAASSRRGAPPPATRPPVVIAPGAPQGAVEGLVGSAERRLESAMRARGFERYSGFKKGRESFATWLNTGSRQCVQSTARDGVVVSISDAGEFACR